MADAYFQTQLSYPQTFEAIQRFVEVSHIGWKRVTSPNQDLGVMSYSKETRRADSQGAPASIIEQLDITVIPDKQTIVSAKYTIHRTGAHSAAESMAADDQAFAYLAQIQNVARGTDIPGYEIARPVPISASLAGVWGEFATKMAWVDKPTAAEIDRSSFYNFLLAHPELKPLIASRWFAIADVLDRVKPIIEAAYGPMTEGPPHPLKQQMDKILVGQDAERVRIRDDQDYRNNKIKETSGILLAAARAKHDLLKRRGKLQEAEDFWRSVESDLERRSIQFVRIAFDENDPKAATELLREWQLEKTPEEKLQDAEFVIKLDEQPRIDLLRLAGRKEEADKRAAEIPELAKQICSQDKPGEYSLAVGTDKILADRKFTRHQVIEYMQDILKAGIDARRRPMLQKGEEVEAEKVRSALLPRLPQTAAKLTYLWLPRPSPVMSLDKLSEVWLDQKFELFDKLCELLKSGSDEYAKLLQESGYKPDWMMSK